jgi:hypothetical protein
MFCVVKLKVIATWVSALLKNIALCYAKYISWYFEDKHSSLFTIYLAIGLYYKHVTNDDRKLRLLWRQ